MVGFTVALNTDLRDRFKELGEFIVIMKYPEIDFGADHEKVWEKIAEMMDYGAKTIQSKCSQPKPVIRHKDFSKFCEGFLAFYNEIDNKDSDSIKEQYEKFSTWMTDVCTKSGWKPPVRISRLSDGLENENNGHADSYSEMNASEKRNTRSKDFVDSSGNLSILDTFNEIMETGDTVNSVKVDEVGDFQVNKDHGTKFIEEELPRIIVKMPSSDGHHANGIIFLDIDDLTVINKKFGREVGDLVIEGISSIIRRRSAFRYSGRCGDDTFYGVVFRTNSGKSYELCQKIKKDISFFPWRSIADKLRVTCTIGSALMKEDEDPYSWFERSIIGMLEGKEKGGNIIQTGPLFLSKKEARMEAELLEAAEKERKQRTASGFSLRQYFS